MHYHPYQVVNTFEMNILENSTDSTQNLERLNQTLRSLLAELPPGLYFGTVEYQSLGVPYLSLQLSTDLRSYQPITLPTFSREGMSPDTSPSSTSKKPDEKVNTRKSGGR